MELSDTFIVKLPAQATCPVSVPGWRVTRLFNGRGYLPPTLSPYCHYLRAGAIDDTLPHEAGDAAPDLLVMAPMGVASDAEIYQSTLDQIQPVPDYASLPAARAWLTAIDSSPTRTPAQQPYNALGFDPHGNQVITLAQDAVCDQNTGARQCGALVASQLALTYTTNGNQASYDGIDGGTVGSVGDLASAVYLATRRWRLAPGPGPLVLNISLGSHPDMGGADPAASPVFGALYDALQVASCQGAIIIASVGNDDTPTAQANETGPLFPAAWESLPAPAQSQCQSILDAWYDGLDPLGNETYAPLVYGVGAIDVSSRALSTQRPGAMPRIAAPGSHLAGANPDTGVVTEAISGTSASSAVAAGAAAVLRTHMPNANAHHVMRVLYKSGVTLLPNAENCLDTGLGACEPTVVVGVCEALAHACDVGEIPNCPPQYASSTCTAAYPPPVPLSPAQAPTIDITYGGINNEMCPGDGSDTVFDGANLHSNCPTGEFYAASVTPLTLPQPSGNICPWCPVYPDGEIDLETTTDVSDVPDLTVEVERDGVTTHYALGMGLSGFSNAILLPTGALDAVPNGTVTGVNLTYTTPGTSGPMTISEPLYITW